MEKKVIMHTQKIILKVDFRFGIIKEVTSSVPKDGKHTSPQKVKVVAVRAQRASCGINCEAKKISTLSVEDKGLYSICVIPCSISANTGTNVTLLRTHLVKRHKLWLIYRALGNFWKIGYS